MSRHHKTVVEQAQRLAAEMPLPMAETLADAIERTGVSSWASARTDILQVVSQPHYRALASEFLDTWQTTAPDLTPQAVAMTLHATAASEQTHRERQSVELVWTGPETQVVPLRQTEQVILQVIESARSRITVVSYAVYRIGRVCETLVRAAQRGVSLRVIVEAPDQKVGQAAYGALQSLGDTVGRLSSVYLWPLEQRLTDDAGNHGVLHLKCIVGDGRWLFLSSANLTEFALTLNMELGILASGGPLPAKVETHFDRLIEAGVLTRV